MKPEGVNVAVYNCHKGNFVIDPEQWRVVHGELPELKIKYDPAHTYDFDRDPMEELAEWGDGINQMLEQEGILPRGKRLDIEKLAVWRLSL